MLHKVTIRELNTCANQMPIHSSVRKDLHDQVLLAIDAKISHILLDDETIFDKHLLNAIAAAKMLEKESNKAKRSPKSQTPYMSVKEYILRGGKL